MNSKLFLCWLYFLTVQSALAFSFSQMYIYIPSWENSISSESNVFSKGFGRSKFECGIMCTRTLGCFSFFYSKISSECRLVQGKLLEGASTVQEMGWNYYLHRGLLNNETYGVPICNSVSQFSLCVVEREGRTNHYAAEQICKNSGHPGFVLVDSEEKNQFIYYVTSYFEKNNRYWIQGIRTGSCDTCFEDDNGLSLTFFKWDNPSYGGTDVQPRPRDRVAFMSGIGFWNAIKHQGWAGILCKGDI